MVGKASLAVNGRQVNVVVAWHDGHLHRARHAVEQGARRLVFTLQCKVGDVARDDDVVGMRGRCCQDAAQVVEAVYPAAVQQQVRVAGDALVEEHTPPLDAGGRQHVQIRDMGNSKQCLTGAHREHSSPEEIISPASPVTR